MPACSRHTTTIIISSHVSTCCPTNNYCNRLVYSRYRLFLVQYFVCLSTPTLYAPACSWYSSTSPPIYRLYAHDTAYPLLYTLFVCPLPFNILLNAHDIHPPYHIYTACVLPAPPIICSIFCMYISILYAPAYSRHSLTSPHLSRLYAHSTAYHLFHFLSVQPHFIYAYMFTTLAHLPTSIPPTCSRHRSSLATSTPSLHS